MSKVSNFPVRESKFQGAGGVTPNEKISLADLLNDLAAAGSLITWTDGASLAAAGGDTPEVELSGQEWSDNVADYVVKIGKYDGAVDDVDKGTAGVTILTLAATPALTDYGAGESINLVLAAKKAEGPDAVLGVGSLQMLLT